MAARPARWHPFTLAPIAAALLVALALPTPVVRVLTMGGPHDTTYFFGSYAFNLGIESGDIPLGASVSLFMFPILAVLAMLILRSVRRNVRAGR